MKIIGSKTFAVIAVTPLLLIAMISLLSLPSYAVGEQLVIISIPSGADVYIDDALMGQTPYLHFVGIPFSVDIRVEMEGFEPWTEFINVELDMQPQLIASLTPMDIDIPGAETVTKTVSATVTTTIISTVISEVTEQIGMPAELTYGVIGAAIIAVIATAIITTRKRT